MPWEWLRRTVSWSPPYQVLLAALGIAIGFLPGLPRLTLSPDLILAVFVPALVFEAALNLNLGALRKMARPVGLLATLGVGLSIGLVGLLVHLLLGLSWPSSFLLGAILSPTDPIAVVGVVRRSGAPAELAALLEGESLFNDGTGVAAYSVVLAAAAGGGFSPVSLGIGFVVLAGAGALIGGLVGLAGAAVVRRTVSAPLEVTVTSLVAYGSYAVATLAGVSGVISVVVAGVAMARVGTWGPHTERWWSRLALVLNVVLFTLIGVGLPGDRVLASLGTVLGGFAILLGVRLLLVHLPGLGVPGRWRPLLWWGGVRGALSVALALASAGHSGVDRSVAVIAYGIVALSLISQGTIVRPAVRLLRLGDRGA
jgi:monovalent cation:H+ antiporter, CPA1 family